MTVVSKTIKIHSKCENDIIDITKETEKIIQQSKIKTGIVTIFVLGSTGALTTIEFEPGLARDFPKMLERIAPKDIEYGHEQMWHDGNGHSHVKASLVGPSITIPFNDGQLLLGTWQQIVFVELDTRGRNRTIILQIIGE
jgi:secondary thiamine-phosphate synthase enzyme